MRGKRVQPRKLDLLHMKRLNKTGPPSIVFCVLFDSKAKCLDFSIKSLEKNSLL